ncbi:MAG: hypothetical protein IJ802_06710 [Kiritimatiellae bacterium]|nr:hypothetical protein [Kiritimatiellia bacterium]
MERIFALVLCGACAVAAMGQEAAIAPKYFGPAAGDVVKGEGAVAEA